MGFERISPGSAISYLRKHWVIRNTTKRQQEATTITYLHPDLS